LKILERAKEAIGIFPIEYKSFLFIYLCKENMVLAQGLSDHVVRNGWKFAKWHKSSHVRDGSPGAVERKKVNKREKWVIWSGGSARGDERADGRASVCRCICRVLCRACTNASALCIFIFIAGVIKIHVGNLRHTLGAHLLCHTLLGG